ALQTRRSALRSSWSLSIGPGQAGDSGAAPSGVAYPWLILTVRLISRTTNGAVPSRTGSFSRTTRPFVPGAAGSGGDGISGSGTPADLRASASIDLIVVISASEFAGIVTALSSKTSVSEYRMPPLSMKLYSIGRSEEH